MDQENKIIAENFDDFAKELAEGKEDKAESRYSSRQSSRLCVLDSNRCKCDRLSSIKHY